MKAIIFDMDGVIIDSEPLHMQLERELLEEYGGTITREEHEAFVGTTDYKIWSTFKERFHLEPSVDELIKIKRQRFMENLHKVKLVDNFYEFMLTVYNEKYLLALASSNSRKIIDKVMDIFDLSKYIKVAISAEDVSKGKPNPEIFLKAAKELNVTPDNCLVIEDAFNGVQAAKAAGMKCVGYKNPNSGNQDLSDADLVVESFRQLSSDIIKGLLGES
ncbi:HAD family phosphatase [Tepidanaerobacter sp. GT38]|uniref:HAD family hydrolase n=1 Tax=Tepidanaerobacter sp. GT38 TaxID=2722793 RepID=UPI001F43C79A|nr:HAD family phosphatase [Tepidanaerobacter sp. GT38]MCG1013122.1 HAD family phosphatase [Tepidanaerobacter sp. GT38]